MVSSMGMHLTVAMCKNTTHSRSQVGDIVCGRHGITRHLVTFLSSYSSTTDTHPSQILSWLTSDFMLPSASILQNLHT